MKLHIDFLEKSGLSDFSKKSLFPSHTCSLIAKHIFGAYDFSKNNKSISCFKKLSQTCHM
ncbi:hypothetical protein Hanom_Chr15g01367701 [Helianthus anomalus]